MKVRSPVWMVVLLPIFLAVACGGDSGDKPADKLAVFRVPEGCESAPLSQETTGVDIDTDRGIEVLYACDGRPAMALIEQLRAQRDTYQNFTVAAERSGVLSSGQGSGGASVTIFPDTYEGNSYYSQSSLASAFPGRFLLVTF